MNPELPSPAAPEPAPDEAAERRWQVLEAYWDAQVRGEQPTATWVAEGADDTPDVREELELLQKLDEARRLLDADSRVLGPSAPAPGAGLPAGTRLGECVIEKLLGQGGMGEVYLARHEELQCPVAVKVLPGPLADDPEARERFRQGVKAQAQIPAHRNIAAALHAGTHAGRPYLVMEYVPGQDLKELVRSEGPLPVARACAAIRQAAEGLAHAHKHGIVHRDIKPSNLMVTPDGTVKILDLGLGKLLAPAAGGEATLTGAGVILGTPDYMAPEALRGQASDLSDVYGLAATLFHLTTGEFPFPAATPDELAAGAGPGLPQADDRFRRVPQRLEGIIRAGLAADQAARPSLPQFIDRLWGALNQTLVDDFLPRPAQAMATPPVKLRLEASRRAGDGWRTVAATDPPADSLNRDIRRVPPRPAQARVRTGEPLRLEVQANRPGYLAVFNVGPTGNLNLLYPLAEYGDAPTVEAGQAVRIGGLALEPPAGWERMFAVWSSRPLPANMRELQGLAEGQEGSRASRSSRDIVQVRRAVEEVTAESRVVVLEVEHEPPG